MTKQDLSKIDFGKLTLPEWCDFKLRVKLDMGRATILSYGRHGDPRVAFLAVDGWAVSPGVDGHLLTELDQLRAICCQVDQFIATELAKPEWVDVRHTEVSRLKRLGVSLRNSHKGENSWLQMNMPGEAIGRASLDYQANAKTVPAGVNLYEPDWVEVKWTEVERLEIAGCHVQVKGGFAIENGVATVVFADRYSGDAGTAGHSGEHYRVDTKTVPDGVALYEPEWVPVGWSNVAKAVEAGVEVYYRPDSSKEFKALSSMPYNRDRGFITNQYQADRKTFPPGFELAKAGPAKPAREVPKCWEAVDFDAFTAKTKTGLDLVLDTSITAVYLCSKETGKRIMMRERDNVWQTLEGAVFVDEPRMADLFDICKRVDRHIEKALNPELAIDTSNPIRATPSFDRDRFGRETLQTPTAEQIDAHRESILARYRDSVLNSDNRAWLPCTRKEAKVNLGCSEMRSIKNGKRHGVWRGEIMTMLDGFQHEYRTRAKVDRWVKVPWVDADRLVRERANVYSEIDAIEGTEKTKPRCFADRSTLPAGYVLGVGFVEEKAEEVKVKTLREKVTAASHGDGPNGKWTKCTVDALIDVLDDERASK